MSEIKEFLNVHDSGKLPCEHIKIKPEDKVKAIDEQIHKLLVLRQELSGLFSGWEINHDNNHLTICLIIENE